MSDGTANLRRKIRSAGDLQSVVRTMKALAASGIGQYEQAVRALADYHRTVELGLGTCLRQSGPAVAAAQREGPAHAGGIGASGTIGGIVFGSDQGLVGRFNDVVADCAVKTLAALPGRPRVWAVGERVHARLADAGLPPARLFAVPSSVRSIAPLVGEIQIESETQGAGGEAQVLVFHNRPLPGSLYEPVSQRLLPLDAAWLHRQARVPWPTKSPPEVVGGAAGTLRTLLREYLFVSLFRACAESLASENASRLAAMERADQNIDELLATLHGAYHRVRQGGIDEELFDVITGFEALSAAATGAGRSSRPSAAAGSAVQKAWQK
jgi:F-type H+-transporting ATPase subunit gamma